MTKKQIKKIVDNYCNNLLLSKETAEMFTNVVWSCTKNKINIVDIELTKHFYPIVCKDKTMAAIKTNLINELKDSWNERGKDYKDILGYDHKLTIKKFLIFLLIKCQKEV